MNSLFFRPLLLCLISLTLPSLVHAATRNVPSATCPTIQSAVDAAHDGDTILVAAGTYSGPGNRDIDFSGKSLVVTSQAGPSSTIIDCGGYKTTDGSGNHRGFYLHSGEKNATISGFTVKNGYETYVSSIPDSDYGGGIFNSGFGGGTLTLTNCTVSGNTATDGGGVYNGGLGTTTTTLTLISCTVSGNTVAGNGDGGGIENGGTGTSTLTLTNCTVSGNTVAGNGNGGGGIENGGLGTTTTTLTSCTVSGNTAKLDGGGIYNSELGGGTLTLTNCTVSGNTAHTSGGIFNIVGTLTLTNCTVSGNTATYYGGVYNGGGTVVLTNCTVSRNTGGRGGGIYSGGGGTLTLRNSIFYGETGGEVVKGSGTVSILFSDIQGGYSGTSNIDKDPLFVNASSGDLHLKPGSPCLGGGTSNGAPPTDIDGNPRPNPPSMGAYELVISTLDILHK